MELIIDNTSNFTSFFDEVQDKSVFSSGDLSFEVPCSMDQFNVSVGSKRKADCLFGSWAEGLCDFSYETGLTEDENKSLEKVSSNEWESSLPARKKPKLEEDDEEDSESSVFLDDARSRSPPTLPCSFDLDCITPLYSPLPEESSPLSYEAAATVSPISIAAQPQTLGNSQTLQISQAIAELKRSVSGLTDARRNAFTRSITRLAASAKQGNPFLMVPTPQSRSCCSAIDQTHDVLTLQMLYTLPMPTLTQADCTGMLSRSGYYPVPTYSVNSPYIMPAIPMQQQLIAPSSLAPPTKWAEVQNYNQTLNRGMYRNACATAPVYYPGLVSKKYVQPQNYATQMISQPTMYSHQPPVHVL